MEFMLLTITAAFFCIGYGMLCAYVFGKQTD